MSSSENLNMCKSEKCTLGTCAVSAKRRNMPPILRLDSTGEVTSHSMVGNRKCELASKMNKSIQNLVNYVGSASSSFIELGSGFSNCLTSERTDSFQRLRNIWKGEDKTSGSKSCDKMEPLGKTEVFAPYWGTTGKGIEAPPCITKQLTSLSSCVWGSLNRNNYDNKFSYPHSFKQHPYHSSVTQQHAKVHHWQSKKDRANSKNNRDFNSEFHLKPYNARLLQKSKMCKGHNCSAETNKPQEIRKEECEKTNVDCKNGAKEVEHNKSTQFSPKADKPKDVKDSQYTAAYCINENFKRKHNEKSDSQVKAEITDWFEYENEDLKTIPVKIDITQKCMDKTLSSDKLEVDSIPVQPALQSWLIIDSETETFQPKPETVPEKQADISHEKNRDKADKQIKKDHNECGQLKQSNSCDIKKVNVNIKDINIGTKSNPSNSDDNNEPTDNSFVLYVRNVPSKKNKPSCKKRRRQKAKQQTSEKINSVDPLGSQKTQDSKQKCEENSIAFILGIDSSSYSSEQHHPFLVSYDLNSDSDWSDCDGDSDESEDSACIPDELSMFSICDNFNPLNFKVTCSLQPTTPTSSHLDAVNLSWQVNVISVDTASLGTKSSDKKVF